MFSRIFASFQPITPDLKAAWLKVPIPPKWEWLQQEELPPWECVAKSPIRANADLQEIRDLAGRAIIQAQVQYLKVHYGCSFHRIFLSCHKLFLSRRWKVMRMVLCTP